MTRIPLGPARRVQQAGELSDPRAVPDSAVGGVSALPDAVRDLREQAWSVGR